MRKNMTTQVSAVSKIKEPMPMTTPSGEQHGLMKVVGNSVPFGEFKRFSEKERENKRKEWIEQGKMVKAVCVNTKDATRRLPMTYCKWEGDPLLSYKFIPDQEYEIPQGLLDQVNEIKVTKRSGILDPKTQQPMLLDQKVNGEWRFYKVG